MFVQVQLLSGWQEPLWYEVPTNLQSKITVGTFLEVPLRTQKLACIVKQIRSTPPPAATSTFREIIGVFAFPNDPHYHSFTQQVASFFYIDTASLHQRIIGHVDTAPSYADEPSPELWPTEATAGRPEIKDVDQDPNFVTLSGEQQTAVDALVPKIVEGAYFPALLHGVTGSGKTEVYKKLIQAAINLNKSVIILLPEVALAMQFEAIFKNQLPFPEKIFSFHSMTKIAEKRQLWTNLLKGAPTVIIGVHLPVLLPVSNLGCIIIDEEHERGFQEKRHPKINSKEIALWRAQKYKCTIVLGSATPSLGTLQNVLTGKITRYRLTRRFKGTFPSVTHVSLVKEKKSRKSFWITKELEAAITECLKRGEQAILYLNRRGHSFSAQCQECGTIVMCESCSVSLTPHATEPDGAFELMCHYCGCTKPVPTECPSCKKSEKPLIMKGIGTQQLTTIVQKLFPNARIARADLDSTKQKREWLKTVEAFKTGALDILIGTQLITKGYHFPKVTLVGVIWADLGLAVPDYHTRETVLQKLIQVAGRAGREHAGSNVIIQSMVDDSLFSYVSEEKYEEFCAEELLQRASLRYPPYGRLVQIEFMHKDEHVLTHEISDYVKKLRIEAQKNLPSVTILGPVEPLVKKIAGIETRHLFFKSTSFQDINQLIKQVPIPTHFKSMVFVIPT